MPEKASEIEVTPGVNLIFTESGIANDVHNAWMPMSFAAVLGNFDELKPVRHYGEYFQDQDKKYAESGKPGLFKGVMERSNPEVVVEFDQLVDEFNADLVRIKEQKDGEAIRSFFDRAGEITSLRPKTDQTPK